MKMITKYYSCAALLFILFAHNLNAQTIVTDRPDHTESSIVIPKGSFQIETGILIGHLNFNPDRTEFLQIPTSLLRIGVFNFLELRVANQFARASNEGFSPENFGFSDIELGFKITLLNDEAVNARISFLSHLLLPFGDKRLSNINYGTINKLLIEHDLNESTLLGYNIGYSYFGQQQGVATYTLVLANMLTEKLGVYGEFYGEWTEITSHIINTDAGFTYLIKNNLQVDISYGIGLNHRMNYFATGISWNFSL